VHCQAFHYYVGAIIPNKGIYKLNYMRLET
jgi:hypothetical protein